MSDKPQQDDLIGKTLGQFEIQEEVGRGGFATVYRGRQQSMNRIVAIKVLPRHLLHDPSFYERFEREVDVIAHLEHPHILPIYDYGQSEGIPYIVMRYLGGGSLEQMIRRGLPITDDVERPLRQIAQALDYAHQQGIIHRDIKPGNIMLDEEGNAYLSDFGIARVLGSDLTGSMIIGTPAYMSPEQANGLPIDGRSDIYSLGIVLFELLTGREPYSAETPMAVLLKHINEPLPSVRDFRGDVPETIEQVIAKATAKDPDDRFSSAGDMAKAYSAALQGQSPSMSATSSAAMRAVAASPAAPSVPEATESLHPTPPMSGGMAQAPTPGPMPAAPPPMAPPVATPPTGQYITESYPTGTIPVKRGPSTGVLVVIVLVVLIVVVGGLGGLLILNQNNEPPPPTVNPNAVPTPFLRASSVQDRLYTVSIPLEWIPPNGFYDLSDGNRLVHLWQDDNLEAYVAVEMWDGNNMPNEEEFRETIEDYENLFVSRNAHYTFLDEVVAEDGTVRRSYYTEQYTGDNSPHFPPGQLDIYYMNRSPYLVALHMFATEDTGNALIRTFQQILDSLRIRAGGA